MRKLIREKGPAGYCCGALRSYALVGNSDTLKPNISTFIQQRVLRRRHAKPHFAWLMHQLHFDNLGREI